MPVTEITNRTANKTARDPDVQRAEMLKKEATLNLLLSHPKGLDKLAAVLTNPVRKYLDYVSICRKLVVVEAIPEGQIAYFDADVDEFTGVKVAEDGSSRFIVCKAIRTQVEPFEIFSKAKVPFKELRIRKYRVFDRMKERLKQSMALKEDSLWFSLFHTASTLTNSEIQSSTSVTRSDLTLAIKEIEKHRLAGVSIVCNPQAVSQIRRWERDTIDEVARIELRRTGYLGNLYGANFYVTTLISEAASTHYSYLYCVTAPEFLAWYPIYADAEVVPADRGDDGLLGLTCYQLSGMIVHNSYGVSRIRFTANV